MISSKDILASQNLKCSLDIFFLLQILLRNSVVAIVEVGLVSEAVVRRCCIKKVLLYISQISQDNNCARASFLIKFQASRLQLRLWHTCFPVKFTKFLRTPFLWNTSCGCFCWCRVFHKFFADLRMSLGLLEYIDLLSTVYNSNIIWFCIFCLSSTLKKVLEHFLSSSSYLMLARSLAHFACFFLIDKVHHLLSFQSLA